MDSDDTTHDKKKSDAPIPRKKRRKARQTGSVTVHDETFDKYAPCTVIDFATPMKERGHNATTLAEAIGERPQMVQEMLRGKRSVNLDVLDRIAAELRIPTTMLLTTQRNDIWLPMQGGQKVVLQVGSRLEQRTHQSPEDGQVVTQREFVPLWDFKAYAALVRHLSVLGSEVHSEVHALRPPGVVATVVVETIDEEIGDRSRIYLASPATNWKSEVASALMYGVRPYADGCFTAFGYGFLWPESRKIVSACGRSIPGHEAVIVNTKTFKILARRTVVASGDGEDGGIILVYGVPAERGRAGAGRGERIIMVLMGLSGPGTLACARVAMDPRAAAELYPEPEKPLARVVRAIYNRPETGVDQNGGDNRWLKDARLVSKEEEADAPVYPEPWPLP